MRQTLIRIIAVLALFILCYFVFDKMLYKQTNEINIIEQRLNGNKEVIDEYGNVVITPDDQIKSILDNIINILIADRYDECAVYIMKNETELKRFYEDVLKTGVAIYDGEKVFVEGERTSDNSYTGDNYMIISGYTNFYYGMINNALASGEGRAIISYYLDGEISYNYAKGLYSNNMLNGRGEIGTCQIPPQDLKDNTGNDIRKTIDNIIDPVNKDGDNIEAKDILLKDITTANFKNDYIDGAVEEVYTFLSGKTGRYIYNVSDGYLVKDENVHFDEIGGKHYFKSVEDDNIRQSFADIKYDQRLWMNNVAISNFYE